MAYPVALLSAWRGKPKRHAYPVICIELDRIGASDDDLDGIDVPIVLATEEEAEAEAARLNALNGSKGVRCYSWLSRFYPEGRAGKADQRLLLRGKRSSRALLRLNVLSGSPLVSSFY